MPEFRTALPAHVKDGLVTAWRAGTSSQQYDGTVIDAVRKVAKTHWADWLIGRYRVIADYPSGKVLFYVRYDEGERSYMVKPVVVLKEETEGYVEPKFRY